MTSKQVYPVAVLCTEVPQWLQVYMDTQLGDSTLNHVLHDVTLTRDNLKRLQERQWLNDEIIHAYVELLIQFYHSSQPSLKVFHVFSLYCATLRETLKGERSAIQTLERMSKVIPVNL